MNFSRSGGFIGKGSLALLLGPLVALSSCIGMSEFEDYPVVRRLALLLGTLPRSHASGIEVGRARLGPAGGELRTPDQILRVTIPPGALADTHDFTVRRYPVQSGEIPPPFWPASEAYEITPSIRFQRDVRVELRVEAGHPDTDVSGLVATDTQAADHLVPIGAWQEYEATRESDRVVMLTRTFSFFVAGRRARTETAAPVPTRAVLILRRDGSDLPDRVRVQVKDALPRDAAILLRVGPAGGAMEDVVMRRESDSQWFAAGVPARTLGPAGVRFRVITRDGSGVEAGLPRDGFFRFPEDTYNRELMERYLSGRP